MSNASVVDYRFHGKPSGTQRVAGTYVALQRSTYAPPRAGVLTWMIYLNVTYTAPGMLRMKMIRAPHNGKPADPTAYHDIVLPAGRTSVLVTQTYFELAEARRSCTWHVRTFGTGCVATIGSRYAKTYLLLR